MYLSCFLIQTIYLGHQIVYEEGKFLIAEIFQLISVEMMLEWAYHSLLCLMINESRYCSSAAFDIIKRKTIRCASCGSLCMKYSCQTIKPELNQTCADPTTSLREIQKTKIDIYVTWHHQGALSKYQTDGNSKRQMIQFFQ